MVDEPIQDDSSYYEISITAGQAFLAVVLLIASLAAAFAFGIVVGEARGGERTVVSNRPAVIEEEGSGDRGTIVELGVDDEPFAQPATESADTPAIEEPELIEDGAPESAPPVDQAPAGNPTPATDPVPTPAVPHFAQILSTTDREPAEKLAARLIDSGYTNAYVERAPSDAGMLYRVRVRFASESEARAAVAGLRQYAPGEIWVSRAE